MAKKRASPSTSGLEHISTGELISEMTSRGQTVEFGGQIYRPKKKVQAIKKKKGGGTVRATVGSNLATTLSNTLVRDRYAALSELVCNAYDADAQNVFITVDSLEGKVVIEDDGTGMDVPGLESFFRLGDSEKVDNPVSPGGRKRVGKYGIATVLLEYLCGSYTVESVQGNKLHTVRDTFDTHALKVETERKPKNRNSGTRIDMRELKFDPDSEHFSIQKLEDRLKWDVPNVLDFNVHLNGNVIRKRSVVEYSSVYEVDFKVGKHAVQGRLYFVSNGKDHGLGARMYVHGRAVGSSEIFNATDIDQRFGKGLSGYIHADFLHDAITLDRSGFQDDPRVEEVVTKVQKVIKAIRNDLDSGVSRRGYYAQDRNWETVKACLEGAEYRFNQKSGLDRDLSFALDFGEQSGSIASLVDDTVYINAENPMLTLLPGKQGGRRNSAEDYLHRALLLVASHAVGYAGLPEEKRMAYDTALRAGFDTSFRKITPIAESVGKYIEGSRSIDIESIPWSSARLYDHFELAHLLGRHPNVIRYMKTSGAAPSTEDDLFRAKEVVPFFEKIEGWTPAVQIVEPRFSRVDKRGGAFKIQYTSPKASEVDLALASHDISDLVQIVDHGVVHPYHFVKDEDVDSFNAVVQEREIYAA